MKVLITGALGHIGSKLIHSIKPGQFEEVVLIDNLITQRYPSLFNLPKGVKFNFFEEDVCTADMNKYCMGMDVVVHLAAITDAASSFDKKDEVEKVNFHGTEKVAIACIKNRCRLFFPSTTSVYGTQDKIVREDCLGLKPQSPYAESKLKAEQLLMNLGQKDELRFVICRFGTIFGSSIGMRFHTAINKFVWQSCMGKPITVWKTAFDQKRPYLYLNDAISAIFYTIGKDLFNNQIFNIVTVNSTVHEITDIIKTLIPDMEIEYVDSKIMNQLSYEVANEKFRHIGFKFSGDLRSGIIETVKILKKARSQ